MRGVDVHTGGSVANTGLAMKRMGADVKLMGKIGNDVFGSLVEMLLKSHGVSDRMIIAEEESTSYSVVLAVPGNDRIFLHNSGANDTFCEADIPSGVLEEADLLHFGYPPLMKNMYQNDGEELLQLMRRARMAGVATSLDMAAVDPDSEAGRVNWRKILERVLPYVDFLCPVRKNYAICLIRIVFMSGRNAPMAGI